MSDNSVGIVQGTNVNSETSPITYKAFRKYGESVQALNDALTNNATIEPALGPVAAHFDQAIRGLYAALADVETAGKYVINDERE